MFYNFHWLAFLPTCLTKSNPLNLLQTNNDVLTTYDLTDPETKIRTSDILSIFNILYDARHTLQFVAQVWRFCPVAWRKCARVAGRPCGCGS